MEKEKGKLLNTYLQQQQAAAPNETGLVAAEAISLEDFKNFVKKWLEIDSYIKKAQDIVKEKKKQRNKLAEVITKFMNKYNIEDLNTKEGRIRCKTTYVKTPMSQKEMKEKITTLVPEKKAIFEQLCDDRPKTQKVGLRRLKIS